MATDPDQLDDIFADLAVKNARPVAKFQPKSKFKPARKNSAATSVSSSSTAIQISDNAPSKLTEPLKSADPSDNYDCRSASFSYEKDSSKDIGKANVPNLDMVTEEHGISVNVPDPEHTHTVISDSTYTNNVPEHPICPELLEDVDHPITASRCEGGVWMNSKECEREEVNVMMDSIDFSELTTTTPVQKTGKYQPKRKVQMRKEVSVLASMESGPNPPQINSASVPELFLGDHDDVLDLSSIELTDNASEPPLNNEESYMNLMENETARVLRPRKSKISLCELEEAEDAAAISEDNHDDEQFEQESESKVKKTRKTDEDKVKPSKKRNKAQEGSAVKPKKFSHSTRRRRVDKVLFETPEDEIDYQKVPLRDLILLAEHKERQMKKDEAAANPAIKQSNGNSSAFHYENETFTSREGEEEYYNNDGQANPTIIEDRNYFNYQTYMDRTPTIRWSKQDTELFYEAVRQFGTDLSMIQHLFPGRTRQQIKLKYKKEEKQHPFRLHDALTTRTKDISHFQKVIDRLKQIAAEEKQNGDNDESIDLTGDEVAEEEDETSHANDEEAKNKQQIEKVENEDVTRETGNREESYGSEDDLLLWSQYKSDT